MATGRIEINESMCKGCEFCALVCPKGLISIDAGYNARSYHPAVFVDPHGECTGCTLCAMICPDAVITVYRDVKVRQVV